MAIATKKPSIKETVGAQYYCFNLMDSNNDFTGEFETNVVKTETVKKVTVTENLETSQVYSSGKLYSSDSSTSGTDIEVETIAFPEDDLAKMRGDLTDAGGLILSGGRRVRPYFAYGKVVRFKDGTVRYDWYPKCKLVENTDETATSEESFSEQTETVTIKAYPFNDSGDIVARVSSGVNFPEGLTEDKFFAAPIMTKEDLAAAVAAV